MRLSRILEIIPGEKKQYREHRLFSFGDENFYSRMEVDVRDRSRHFWLVTGKKEENSEFIRSRHDTDLTDEEITAGVGLLRVGHETMKASIQDVDVPTVRLRVNRMLEAWPDTRRKAMTAIYSALAHCNLEVGKGDLVSFLFSDGFPQIGAGSINCSYTFVFAEPDSKRDQRFLSLEPNLEIVFRHPGELMNDPKRKRP